MASHVQICYQIQQQSDISETDDWLSPREAVVLNTLKFNKRNRDWRLGRWTAKLALSRYQPDTSRLMKEWEVLADDQGAPSVFLAGKRLDIPLSLSHSAGLCLVALASDVQHIGCDMEQVEQRSRSFEETFFTPRELDLLECYPASHRACLVTLIWSAKESVLKALRIGLQADTRRVEILCFETPVSDCWQAFTAEDQLQQETFHGWWRHREGMIQTVVSNLQVALPIEL